MSLVNLSPASAATTAVDPILYDSGWKRISGTGAAAVIETMKYDVDTVVRIFAKSFKVTLPTEWKLYIDLDGASSLQSFSTYLNLHRQSTSHKTGSSALEYGQEYMMMLHSATALVNQASEDDNATGLSLGAGSVSTFRSTSSASTSDGIEYRIIVERSTSAVMLGRSLGKPQ